MGDRKRDLESHEEEHSSRRQRGGGPEKERRRGARRQSPAEPGIGYSEPGGPGPASGPGYGGWQGAGEYTGPQYGPGGQFGPGTGYGQSAAHGPGQYGPGALYSPGAESYGRSGHQGPPAGGPAGWPEPGGEPGSARSTGYSGNFMGGFGYRGPQGGPAAGPQRVQPPYGAGYSPGGYGFQGGGYAMGAQGGYAERDVHGPEYASYGMGAEASRETARGRFTGRGPKNYRRSDERIREDVCEELSRHGEIDASEIEVAVKDGEVSLTGTVETRWEKRLAEDAAEGCSGVRDVHNQIRVQPHGAADTGPAEAGRPPAR